MSPETERLPSRSTRYLSTSIVALRLGVSARTVRLWAECGELPAMKFGRQWKIDSSAFSEWLTSKTSGCDLGMATVFGNIGRDGNHIAWFYRMILPGKAPRGNIND